MSFITVAEASELTGLAHSTIYKAFKDGKLNGFQACKRGAIRIDEDSIKDMNPKKPEDQTLYSFRAELDSEDILPNILWDEGTVKTESPKPRKQGKRSGFCVWVPQDLYEYVKTEANNSGIAMSEFVEQALLRDKSMMDYMTTCMKFLEWSK